MPAPARLTQVAIVALCCENTPEDRLCVMVKSLNLPMGAPTLPLLSTPHDDEPTLKRPKFSARAQPHRPPVVVVPRQVSRAVALSDSANDLWHADLLSLPSSSHSLSVTLLSLTNTPSRPRSQHPLKPLKSPVRSRRPVCQHVQKVNKRQLRRPHLSLQLPLCKPLKKTTHATTRYILTFDRTLLLTIQLFSIFPASVSSRPSLFRSFTS